MRYGLPDGGQVTQTSTNARSEIVVTSSMWTKLNDFAYSLKRKAENNCHRLFPNDFPRHQTSKTKTGCYPHSQSFADQRSLIKKPHCPISRAMINAWRISRNGKWLQITDSFNCMARLSGFLCRCLLIQPQSVYILWAAWRSSFSSALSNVSMINDIFILISATSHSVSFPLSWSSASPHKITCQLYFDGWTSHDMV